MPGLIKPKFGVTQDNLNPTGISYTPSNKDPSLINTGGAGIILPKDGSRVNMSYIEGALRAKDEIRKDQSMAMQQQYANQSAQRFQWEGQDREKQQEILTGMQNAAQSGGYTGVIQYLQKTDPSIALKFEKSKNELDQAMMETQTYQLAHSNDKLKVMVEGYDILSKMGSGLLNAQPEERENMYQAMLPMVKQVNPNAPDTLDDKAISMFMLAAAQRDPNSLKLQSQQVQEGAATYIAKLHQDYNNYIAKGGSPDDPTAQDIQKQIQATNNKADQAKDVADQAHYKNIMQGAVTAKNNFTLQSSMQKNYDQRTKPFMEKQMALANVKAQLQELLNGNPNAGIALQFAIARVNNGAGALTQPDVDAASGGDSGVAQIQKKLLSAVGSEGQVTFNDREKVWLKDLVKAYEKAYTTKLNDINNYYQQQAIQFSRPPSQDGTDKGFQIKLNYVNNPSADAVNYLVNNPTPEVQAQFKQKYGLDPAEYINQASGGNY